jgi:AraC-like DNA-binding protein
MSIDVRATGYHYFGWTWRGCWQGQVAGEIKFDSDVDGCLHLSGQVKKNEVIANIRRDVGQIFLELSVFGHFELFGITGETLLENAAAPHVLNPALKSHLAKLKCAETAPTFERMELMATVLSELPKHNVPEGMKAAVGHMDAADGDIRISDMLAGLGIAERQFRTEFKRLIGLTPKAFCNTLRINRAVNQLLQRNAGDLADVAAQTGFSDQAHFTRAFSDFLGAAPRRYIEDIEVTLARFLGQSRQ